MSFQGMDPQAVAVVADRIDLQADALEQIAGAIDGAIRAALAVWPGPDADDFNSWWVNQHRPRLMAAAQATQAAAAGLRQQVADQVEASGQGGGSTGGGAGGGFFGGFAGAVIAAGGALAGAWDATARIRGLEGIAAGFAGLRAGGDELIKWSHWTTKYAHTGLGILGAATDLVDIYAGFAENDDGKKVTGIAGLGSALAPTPLSVAGGAALLYGDLTLPTNNEEYAGTYNMALSQHFGDAYDPANPTPEQVEWGMQRYSGFMGFLNSISDGMDYTIDGWMPGGRR